MVDLIDVGMGNICSINNILRRLGVSCKIVSDPSSLSSQTILLPGVGSALPFMNRIREYEFDKAIYSHVDKGHKIIGICLGFQAMTDYSDEDGGIKCLGLIKTRTEAISTDASICNHNQWENFTLRKDELELDLPSILVTQSRKRVIRGRVFYNHEYGVRIPLNNRHYKSIGSGSLSRFASLYCNNNIIGVQFHPEKSQYTGLDLLSFIL